MRKTDMNISPLDLLNAAKAAAKHAYAPYSGCKVGAALLTRSGEVIPGCNVENASFGVTCCAERTALFSAVARGARRFDAIAVVCEKDGKIQDFFPPCGVCRQALAEFCGPDFAVILPAPDGGTRQMTLSELLPCGFTGSQVCTGEESE